MIVSVKNGIYNCLLAITDSTSNEVVLENMSSNISPDVLLHDAEDYTGTTLDVRGVAHLHQRIVKVSVTLGSWLEGTGQDNFAVPEGSPRASEVLGITSPREGEGL